MDNINSEQKMQEGLEKILALTNRIMERSQGDVPESFRRTHQDTEPRFMWTVWESHLMRMISKLWERTARQCFPQERNEEAMLLNEIMTRYFNQDYIVAAMSIISNQDPKPALLVILETLRDHGDSILIQDEILRLLDILRMRFQQEIFTDKEIFQELEIATMDQFMKDYGNPMEATFRWWRKEDPELLTRLYYQESKPGIGDRLIDFLNTQIILGQFPTIQGEMMEQIEALTDEEERDEKLAEIEEHLIMLAEDYPMELLEMYEKKELLDYLQTEGDWFPNPDVEDPNNYRGKFLEDREAFWSQQ